MKNLCLIIALFTFVGCASNETKPIDVYALQKTALFSYKAKDWPRAHDAFRRLVELNPADAELWFKLGNVYARMNLPDKSIASYKEALVRDPQMSKAWHNIGVISLRKSARLFAEMLKHIDPNDPLYSEAKKTGDALLKVLEERKLNPARARNYPGPLEGHQSEQNNDNAK